MLNSLNFYYAIPGNEAAVLRQRLRACDVRLELGIPRGRVLERTSGASELPDVVWELVFPDISGHRADMAVRAASPAFEAVRLGMRKLCRRFERPLFDICEGAAPAAGASSSGVICWDWIFCPPERTDDAVRVVQKTASSSAAPAPATSRILRLVSDGADLPSLLWQREYAASGPDGALSATLRSEYAKLGARVEPSRWSEHRQSLSAELS